MQHSHNPTTITHAKYIRISFSPLRNPLLVLFIRLNGTIKLSYM